MSKSDSHISTSAEDAESPPDHQTGGPSPPPPPPPLPPLLVSAPPTGLPEPSEFASRPSVYLDKLASMPDDYLSQAPKPRPYVYQPIYYFFYGTLTRSNILKEVLGLNTEPALRPAKVYGYELTNWGQYKALVDGAQGEEVTGYAYLVESADHEYKLAYYETNAYVLAPCKIHFNDGCGERDAQNSTYGRTFMYAGDAAALKAGRFDRALWEMQMGRRLPPAWKREDGAGGTRTKTEDQETQ